MALKPDGGQSGLSPRERWKVIGIALGFLLVLGFTACLALNHGFPATIVAGIPDAFRAGQVRRGRGQCTLLAYYVVGLPAGIILSVVMIVQGAKGRRTRLTRWLLREMSQGEVRKRHERMLASLEHALSGHCRKWCQNLAQNTTDPRG